jgi:hypothetical protein
MTRGSDAFFARHSTASHRKRSDTDDSGCGSQSQHVQPWLHRKRPIWSEMGNLIYAAIASLDGYVEDEEVQLGVHLHYRVSA